MTKPATTTPTLGALSANALAAGAALTTVAAAVVAGIGFGLGYTKSFKLCVAAATAPCVVSVASTMPYVGEGGIKAVDVARIAAVTGVPAAALIFAGYWLGRRKAPGPKAPKQNPRRHRRRQAT